MNLYEINKELQAKLAECVDEDGCIIEGMESTIDDLFEAKDEKLLNCAKYIKNESAFVDMIKSEEKALNERRKKIESRIEWMKKYVLSNMEEGEKVSDSQATIATRKSKAVEITEEAILPTEYCSIVPQTYKADKAKIKKAIESGKEVTGAKIIERLNLNIK